MFGYVYVNEQELKLKEWTVYRSFYCGLCQNLKKRYGRTAQMMLNYDLTFLGLLLTGLYEPDTTMQEHRCVTHPVRKHRMVNNTAIDYAADMSVLLSWQKLRDNWEDERSPIGLGAARLLKKDYERLKESYPRQAAAIEENIRLLHEAERTGNKDVDYVAGMTGHFLAEVYVWKEDLWQEELRTMGFYIGKFVYLLDAMEDVKKDRKKKNYNLFETCENVWDEKTEPQMREMLTSMVAEAARAFERLPVLEHAEILRNILYSGIWTRYVLVRDALRRE